MGLFSIDAYCSVKTLAKENLKCFKVKNVENLEIRQSSNWYGFSYKITRKECSGETPEHLAFRINSGNLIKVKDLPKSIGTYTNVRITYKSQSIVNNHIITVREI